VARVLPADRSRDGIKGGLGNPTHGRLDPWRFTDCDKSIGAHIGVSAARPDIAHIALGWRRPFSELL
jgi:hypothetical protein